MLINFVEFEEIPNDSFYTLNINYKVKKQILLTTDSIAYYSIRYDVLSKEKIVKSEVLNYKLFESEDSGRISINLKYNQQYKILFKLLDLNSNSYIYDSSIVLKLKLNPYLQVGSIKIDKRNYDQSDTILKIKIPIYSNISDSIEVNLRVESSSFLETKSYKIQLSKGLNDALLSYIKF